MKVSFDFDGTLSRKDVQKFAKELVNSGHEVWIVTSRFDDEYAKKRAWWWVNDQNKILFDVANECGIIPENIHFTNQEPKILFLKDKNYIFHLDDDIIELINILESKDSCVPLNVGHFSWKENCLELLN
jgi:hypothetical protein